MKRLGNSTHLFAWNSNWIVPYSIWCLRLQSSFAVLLLEDVLGGWECWRGCSAWPRPRGSCCCCCWWCRWLRPFAMQIRPTTASRRPLSQPRVEPSFNLRSIKSCLFKKQSFLKIQFTSLKRKLSTQNLATTFLCLQHFKLSYTVQLFVCWLIYMVFL